MSILVLSTLAISTGCGARSSLSIDPPADVGAGGAGSSVTSSTAAGPGAGGGPSCRLDDPTTWRTERYRDQGDYERFATAASNEPWVALKVRSGNIVLAKLTLDPAQGIVLSDRVDVADSPVYPVAMDVDARRFVMLTTTGINWNGDVELWRIDRQTGTVLRVPVGNPPSDPAYTLASALSLAGDDVLLTYGRPAVPGGVVELRDDQLGVIDSVGVADSIYTAVHQSDSSADVYVGKSLRVHAESGALTSSSVDPDWQVIGGVDGFLVDMGQQIRLTHGSDIWPADWPHTQISPPAVVRVSGSNAVFSLETELTAVVGHVGSSGLEWMRIEPASGADGIGVGIMPVLEKGRLGLFYLGLEIPHPEQPLRYYGIECH